jgi:putative copper export protein/mono/diheme cytochrome c family protein/peroxiredoxin
MNELLASARAVHFAATMWLFGELVLACALSNWRGRDEPAGPGEVLRQRLPSVARWSIAIGIASAVAWLAAVAATMSGMPLPLAIDASTLGAVIGGTLFGRVWIARVCLACALLLALRRRSAGRGGWRLAFWTAVAGAYLASLAWTGHAAAAQGPWRGAQIISDVVHLLAAGAWLGALPALVYLLGTTQPVEGAASATRRFSNVAIVCVFALILSGLGNSWFLVGSVPALFGTTYGRLLLAKLALLAVMLILAAVNRLMLTPQLGVGNRRALLALRRNTLLEIAAGLLVVTIVGVLGITVPGAHQSPLWPFAHTLSWEPARESAAMRWALAAAVLIGAVGLALIVASARRRAWPSAAVGLAGIVASAAASAWLLAVPAYPTTYAASPVRYTTVAVVDGARLFSTHCVACHGNDGTGASPAAAGLATRPANLVRHAGRHRPGELYWWIAHGRAGTAMPGFAPPLGSEEIWSIVQFLQALSDAAVFVDADGEPTAIPPLPAPDFSFELPGRGQQTLLRRDKSRDTLLVLYSLPDSLARLRSLASEQPAFAARRIEILAVTSNAAEAHAAGAETSGSESILAIVAADVAVAYAMFAARDGAVAASRHAEFLIDRGGRLRAHWIGVPEPGNDRNLEILDTAAKVDRESFDAPLPREHSH